MNKIVKNTLRTAIKVNPIAKAVGVADMVLPLPYQKSTTSNIVMNNPLEAYSTNVSKYSRDQRQTTFKKPDTYMEDAISGAILGTGIAVAGGMTGNPQLMGTGINQAFSSFKKKDDNSLEGANATVDQLLDGMMKIKKNKPIPPPTEIQEEGIEYNEDLEGLLNSMNIV
jgi:hypothetical protein